MVYAHLLKEFFQDIQKKIKINITQHTTMVEQLQPFPLLSKDAHALFPGASNMLLYMAWQKGFCWHD